MPGQDAAVPGRQRPSAARRLAAVAALMTLAVAAVLLLVGIASHLAAVVLAFICLLVGVTAGWYAVSRRGVVRVIAVTVVVVSVAALGAGLFFADISVRQVILIAALGGVSVLAARYALKRTRWQLRAGTKHLVRAGRAAHPILIMNPKSGDGKADRFHLPEECRKRGIEPVVLRPGDDLLWLAEDAIARGADVIGMAGGDGSQALVATVAARHDVPHVCVPAGTRNHFALDLGLDRSDVVGALDAFTDGVELRIDLASVNGRTFVNNASLGLYAEIVQSPGYRDAKVKTAASVLPDLLGPDTAPLDPALRRAGRPAAPHGTTHPGVQRPVSAGLPRRPGHPRADRPGRARDRDGRDRRRRRRQEVRRARGGGPGPSVPRLGRVERTAIRGPLQRPGADRPRR